jgi:hypothetical protein
MGGTNTGTSWQVRHRTLVIELVGSPHQAWHYAPQAQFVIFEESGIFRCRKRIASIAKKNRSRDEESPISSSSVP